MWIRKAIIAVVRVKISYITIESDVRHQQILNDLTDLANDWEVPLTGTESIGHLGWAKFYALTFTGITSIFT